ncbi:MAG: hypothetical protein Kow0077_12900 [Anaerolineae bacterium]
MPARTRLQQGIRALTAWAQPVDWALAESVLTPPQMALFRRMRRSEQLHSLRVLRDLQAAGETDPDLMVAALLHDVGKTAARFWLPERVLVVLVRKFAPARHHHWGQTGTLHDWRKPFAISLRHPEWSAQMLERAGGTPRSVALVRQHADPVPDPPRNEFERLLAVLQWADNRN